MGESLPRFGDAVKRYPAVPLLSPGLAAALCAASLCVAGCAALDTTGQIGARLNRIEANTATIDQSTRGLDEWSQRLALLYPMVETVSGRALWALLALPVVTYILPKLIWILTARLWPGAKCGTRADLLAKAPDLPYPDDGT